MTRYKIQYRGQEYTYTADDAEGDFSKSCPVARRVLEDWIELDDDSLLDPSDIFDVVDLLSLAEKWLKKRTSGGV